MKYNVLLGAEWDVNTTDGNVDLDYADLYGLMDYGDTVVTSLSGADVLVVDFDFGYRIHLDRFEYKYATPYATAVDVASGIEFYYKNESFDSYMPITTYVAADDVYFTTISGGLYAPRYMRMKHEVANTQNASTISGAVYGFKAFNNDTVVDFGEDGTAASSNIEVVREDLPDIRAIAIYNSGDVLVDAYVNIEPDNTGIDYALSISASEQGPWTYVFDPTTLVADSDNFGHGEYEDLNADVDAIRITGLDLYDGYYATQNSYGVYTTKVFAQGDSDYTRFVIEYSGDGEYLTTDTGDPVETIEVRSSNTRPITYLAVVELYDYSDGGYHYYRYRDRWVPSESVKSVGTQNFFDGELYSRYNEHTIFMDQLNENYAGFAMHYHTDSRSSPRLYLFRNNLRSGLHKYKTLSYTSDYTIRIDYIPYDLKLDYSSGMWVYFYCKTYTSGTFVDTNGYYLVYFDSDLVDSFKYISTEEELGTLSNNYDTKELWYTKPATMAIYLLTHAGYVEVNFTDEDLTYDLGGIACLPDGNLLFANDKDLHRLHKDGYPMEEYTIEDIAGDKLAYIALDPTESYAAWAIDGTSVGRFFYEGSRKGDWDFKVSVNLPIRFEVVDTGVWVKCAGESGESGIIMRYISKENKRVDFEYESDADRSQPALHCQTYEHEYYTEKMPIASDNVWPSLAWRKVNLHGYLASEDNYYQMRLTLRRQDPISRYPEFVTDSTQDYIYEDYFMKNSSTPEQLLWSDWLNKPALDRVYVDTSEDVLVLEPTALPTGDDAYISTQNRIALGVDDSAKFEARIGYIIADGDGVPTGQDENIYIYAYSVEDGFEGNYMAARLRLDDNINSSNSTIYCIGAGGWDSDNVVLSDSYYEGEFALYWNSTYAYASVRANDTGSWTTLSVDGTSQTLGNYFYIKIVVPKESSRVKIKYFTVPYGTAYFYTETPRVTSINKQYLVKIEDVYPNSYKNVYLRSYVSRDLELSQSSEVDMKVRWRIPVY